MKNQSYQNGNVIIEFNDDHVPKNKEDLKQNLTKVYDVINKISHELEEKGIYTKEWFLTSKQIEKMKKSEKYNFI